MLRSPSLVVHRRSDSSASATTSSAGIARPSNDRRTRSATQTVHGTPSDVSLFSFLPSLHSNDRTPDDERYAHPERDRPRRVDTARDKRAPSRSGFQNVPTAPRADRNKSGPNPSASMMPPPPPPSIPDPASQNTYTPPMTDGDLSAIRSRYLGVDKKKRKIRKMNDRKFVFDWDTQDDTFAADSPVAVGSLRQGAQVMFGRGHIAGMMDDRPSPAPRRHDPDPNLADAMERRKAAKSGLDDRHWSDKPLDEMKERDWRIFREDFSISARGGVLSSTKHVRC